jgi:hypothetical protein
MAPSLLLLLLSAAMGVGAQVLPGVDDQLFLDTLHKMPQQELKKFVRANGGECEGCKKKEWLAKAKQVVKGKSAAKSGWAGGNLATAPDGGMQMSRDEFKIQLLGSLGSVDGIPAMDEAQIEDMWLDFSKKIRLGEVGGARPGSGIFGDMFRSRSAEGWMQLVMMAGLAGTSIRSLYGRSCVSWRPLFILN